MPTISVIVPIYNVEPYIHRCIDSILAQTYSDFELILVDDGSPDNCGAICDKYAAKDSRIRVIHKENGGVSSARNAGLDIATGEYVTFVDSDDFCNPDWFFNLYNWLQNEYADVVSGGFSIVDERGGVLSTVTYPIIIRTISNERELEQHIVHDILLNKIGWSVWTRFFKTDIIRKNKIRFCESCGNYAEDQGFVLEYSLFCKKIICTDIVGYQYVQRSNSMMHISEPMIRFNEKNEVSHHFFKTIKTSQISLMFIKDFPLFHYLIMSGQYNKINKDRMKYLEFELQKIRKTEWYTFQTKELLKHKKELKTYLGYFKACEAILFSKCCLNPKSYYYQMCYVIWMKIERIRHRFDIFFRAFSRHKIFGE